MLNKIADDLSRSVKEAFSGTTEEQQHIHEARTADQGFGNTVPVASTGMTSTPGQGTYSSSVSQPATGGGLIQSSSTSGSSLGASKPAWTSSSMSSSSSSSMGHNNTGHLYGTSAGDTDKMKLGSTLGTRTSGFDLGSDKEISRGRDYATTSGTTTDSSFDRNRDIVDRDIERDRNRGLWQSSSTTSGSTSGLTTGSMGSSSTGLGSGLTSLEGAHVKGKVTTQQPSSGWFGSSTKEQTTDFSGTMHATPESSGATRVTITSGQPAASSSTGSSSWFDSNSSSSNSSSSTGSSWFGSGSGSSDSSHSSSSTGSSWFGSSSSSSDSTTRAAPTSSLIVGSREQGSYDAVNNPDVRANQGIYDPNIQRAEGTSTGYGSTSTLPRDDKNKMSRDTSSQAGATDSNTEHISGVITVTKDRRDM